MNSDTRPDLARALGRPFLRYHSTPRIDDGTHVVIVEAPTEAEARAFAIAVCRTDVRQPVDITGAAETISPAGRRAYRYEAVAR